MGIDGTRRAALRALLLTLALMALAVRIVVPQGFMAAPAGQGGFPLVICTGHGPMTMPGDPKSPPAKDGHDGVCVFAGAHPAPPPPAPLLVAGATAVVFVQTAVRLPASPTPGRGLAAPPPPSRAPPRLA